MYNSNKQLWEDLYASKAENNFNWYQAYPKTSIEFIESVNLPLEAKIIDVGGGDSHFADALLDKGYKNIYVLDISLNALAVARRRLNSRGSEVHWLAMDILDFQPWVQFDFWHDRAAF